MDITSDTLFEAIASSNMAHTLSAIDNDRPLIYVNQAFLDETGYSREEVIGKNCRFLQGEGTDSDIVEKIRDALDNFKPIDVEILNYRKNGAPFLNRLRMSTVFDNEGNPLAYMGIQSNVNTLVENVRIAQEKYKMESLGRLSANISHEIKNALQPIRLMLENLQDAAATMPPEQIERCVSIAMENMAIAENTVKDVLRFSQHNYETKETVTVKDLSENVVRFVKNLIPKTATLQVKEELQNNKTTFLQVHQNNILQVMTNLVNNALDATNQAGELYIKNSIVEVKASNQYGLSHGQYFVLSLSDNGEGIDEKILKNVFQPFFSTKSPGEGTGLGLAISMRIANDHEGTLIARNNESSGTTFSLFLSVLKA